jgi:TPR repeat protein
MKKIILLYFCFFSFSSIYSQSKISTDFYGKENIRAELCDQSKGFMSEQDVEGLIANILSMQGLNNRFVVLACTSVENCIATIDKNNRPIILYNPNFLKSVKKLGFKEADIPSILEKDWSTLTILAHEIGHHLNNHITNPLPGATHIQLELEADKTAGFLIYLMGGTLEKAKMAFQGISETGGYTHPKRQDRIAALTNGYDDAKNKFPKIIKTIVTNPGSSKSEIEQEIQRAINLYDNKSYTEAFVLLKKNDDNPQTWNYLGKSYELGFGVTQDFSEAVRWYRKSAEQGEALGQRNLGVSYLSGIGVTQDYSEAVRWFRKSADQGDALSQCCLGQLYNTGNGVTQDNYEAVRWFRKSADQGDQTAQFRLGIKYANGEGVTKNYSEAVRWYRKSADQGFADAQILLGTMYANGEGVTKNYSEAVRWYRKSADQGDANAQILLGFMYFNGQGLTKDYSEAARWFRKSADQGTAVAQSVLGTMYENGIGVTKNLNEAKIWYQKAAVNGDEEAKKACTRLGISW